MAEWRHRSVDLVPIGISNPPGRSGDPVAVSVSYSTRGTGSLGKAPAKHVRFGVTSPGYFGKTYNTRDLKAALSCFDFGYFVLDSHHSQAVTIPLLHHLRGELDSLLI